MTRFLLRLWQLPFPDWLRWVMLWAINARFLATVAAVVRNERGEVLLFHHTYRTDCAWGLPGGWLKKGEEPGAAIAREIMEESGLRVAGLVPLWVGGNQRHPRLDIVFMGRLEGGVFRPSDEVNEARFFSTASLPRVTPGTLALISAAEAFGPPAANISTDSPDGL